MVIFQIVKFYSFRANSGKTAMSSGNNSATKPNYCTRSKVEAILFHSTCKQSISYRYDGHTESVMEQLHACVSLPKSFHLRAYSMQCARPHLPATATHCPVMFIAANWNTAHDSTGITTVSNETNKGTWSQIQKKILFLFK